MYGVALATRHSIGGSPSTGSSLEEVLYMSTLLGSQGAWQTLPYLGMHRK